MIALMVVAVPVVSLSVWLYLKTAPAGTTFRSRAKFEAVVVVLEIAGCAVAAYMAYTIAGRGVDRAWWPVVALIYILALIPSLLIPAALIRKVIYRKAAGQGRPPPNKMPPP